MANSLQVSENAMKDDEESDQESEDEETTKAGYVQRRYLINMYYLKLKNSKNLLINIDLVIRLLKLANIGLHVQFDESMVEKAKPVAIIKKK